MEVEVKNEGDMDVIAIITIHKTKTRMLETGSFLFETLIKAFKKITIITIQAQPCKDVLQKQAFRTPAKTAVIK